MGKALISKQGLWRADGCIRTYVHAGIYRTAGGSGRPQQKTAQGLALARPRARSRSRARDKYTSTPALQRLLLTTQHCHQLGFLRPRS